MLPLQEATKQFGAKGDAGEGDEGEEGEEAGEGDRPGLQFDDFCTMIRSWYQDMMRAHFLELDPDQSGKETDARLLLAHLFEQAKTCSILCFRNRQRRRIQAINATTV